MHINFLVSLLSKHMKFLMYMCCVHKISSLINVGHKLAEPIR
jgi:hypothetical protein